VESFAERFGERIDVVIFIDLDRLAGGVADHKTVVAPLQMFFQLRFELDVSRSVQILV
jgi:hypothetical protein